MWRRSGSLYVVMGKREENSFKGMVCWSICIEFPPRSTHQPAVSFEISRIRSGVLVQKCHTARQVGTNLSPENDNIKKDATEPVSVCVDVPDVSNYPRDLLEYPPRGTKTPKVGDIEILYQDPALFAKLCLMS